jgi:Protein of unknown function (DUF1302)
MNSVSKGAVRKRVGRLSLLTIAVMAACGVHAMELETSDPDLNVRLDNTVKASATYRLNDANPALVNSFAATGLPQALNFNAGNDNFRKQGFVSQRVDLLSEFDLVYQKKFGFRISAAGWNDQAYSGDTKATDPLNSQNPANKFAAGTPSLAGNYAELMDAFVFGGWDLGDGKRLTARLGQHSLIYGESLFFGENGIAKAQGPLDINKLMSSPNAQFKEFVRPVPQLSANLQLSPDVSIGGYYQFQWVADRLPPSGSYFSNLNVVWGSQQNEFVSGAPLTPGGDQNPKDDGQYGMQIKWHLDGTDLGFYAARFHAKDGQLYSKLDIGPLPGGGFGPVGGKWKFIFPEGITTTGASVSRTFDNANVAAEVSVRDNMPLNTGNIVYPGFLAAPDYAKGKTAHINLSTVAGFGPSFIAQEAMLTAEIAWNRVLEINDPANTLDPTKTRDASALQFVFSPQYRQVAPGLDLAVPFGMRYSLAGNSSVSPWDAAGNGSVSLGLEGTYLGVWQFAVNYTHFIGEAMPVTDYRPLATGGNPIGGMGNPNADRDNLTFSLRRTF